MNRPVDPFIQPIPEFFISADDPELRSWAEYLNRFLHDLWERSGGGDDNFANLDIGSIINNTAKVKEINDRLGSGIPFTIDTSGFTIDTGFITTDKGEQ